MNWRFWMELTMRSGLLLSAGIALLKLCRTATPAFRHRLVFSLFLLLALLPVLFLLLPEIPVSLWSSASGPAEVTIQQLSSRALQTSAHAPLSWLLTIWLTGFIAACIPLLAGMLSAWRIKRLAKIANPPILISQFVSSPITTGIFHPKIILPKSAENWTHTRLQAVLLHESAHIRRHDLPIQFIAHVISALWWFQPLVWLLRRRLRAESELACDAEAIHSGLRPSQYAEELLGVARTLPASWKLSSSAIGMARTSGLEERLRAILHPQAASLPRHTVYAIGIILGAASIAASSLSVSQNSEPGGSTMKHAITSALLVSAGLSTAGFVTASDHAEAPPKHIHVRSEVAESNLLVKVTPVYPVSAKQAHIQGIVELSLTITKEGVPLDLRVLSSPSADLSESALEAVRQWRYRPTLLNGQPVEIDTTVVVHYTLRP